MGMIAEGALIGPARRQVTQPSESWIAYAGILGLFGVVLVLCALPFCFVPSLKADAFAVWFLAIIIWFFLGLGCAADWLSENWRLDSHPTPDSDSPFDSTSR